MNNYSFCSFTYASYIYHIFYLYVSKISLLTNYKMYIISFLVSYENSKILPRRRKRIILLLPFCCRRDRESVEYFIRFPFMSLEFCFMLDERGGLMRFKEV